MKIRIPLGFLFLLALSSSALCRDLGISVLGVGQVVADPAYDPLSSDDGLGLAQLEFGVELPELLHGLSIELAYEGGQKEGELFCGGGTCYTTQLQMHGALLGAAYRYPVLRWMNLSARAGASMDFAQLRVKNDGGLDLSQWANARMGAYGLLGFEIYIPGSYWSKAKEKLDDDSGFRLGVRFELGWSIKQAFAYDQMRTSSGSGQDPGLQYPALDMGSVNLDGFMFRAGAYVVF